MARRQEIVTIPGVRSDANGQRDNGKAFVVTELPALEGEPWCCRLIRLIAEQGIQLPEGVDENSGAAGLAQIMSEQLIEVAPLLSLLHDPELDVATWKCIKYQHAPNHPAQPIAHGDACQIEEISTVMQLRIAVLKMHTGFFSPVKASPTSSASPSPATPTGLSPTRISRPRSVR